MQIIFGYSTRMLQIMKTMANEMGIRSLEATLRSNILCAIQFYLKHAYEMEGTKKTSYINEKLVDEYYSAKFIG